MANTLKDMTPQLIVAEFSDRVFAIVIRLVGSRMDAEEITQDVFLKVFKKTRSFRGQSGLSTWIYRVAYNEALDFLRRRRKQQSVEINERMDIVETDVGGDQKELELVRLERALTMIDSRDALLVDLYYWQKMGVAEIGEIVGMSRDNVKVRLHRVRQQLAQMVRNME